MIYLEVLGSRILVLGNEESVMDLLDRRVNFAYRIETPMFIDLYVLCFFVLSLEGLNDSIGWISDGLLSSVNMARTGANNVDSFTPTFTVTSLQYTRTPS
jgi:hypothetical protein